MTIEKVVLGPLFTNCYILSEKEETILIDPAAEPEKIFEALPTINVSAIFLTHAHPDHLGALPDLKNEFPKAKFLLHRKDFLLFKRFLPMLKPDDFLKGGKFSISNFQFSIFHTPGHTPGSICLRIENFLFTGDTLFARGVGRTDFWGGSQKELIKSLKKLKNLPKNLKIYPGHGPSTSLGQALERQRVLLGEF